MNDSGPRPNLNQGREYLGRVKNLLEGKGEMAEIHFEYLNEALRFLGIDADPFEGITTEEIPSSTREIIESSFERIAPHTENPDFRECAGRLWDHLAESDPLEKADLIFVFGGISVNAVLEAIRLKNEEYAPKILFSGKHGSYMKDVQDLSEAEKYAALAIENGVPESDILLEKESMNTPENIVNSAKLLHSLGEEPKSVIAVSIPYHLKRGTLTMKAGFDWDFNLIRHAGPSAKFTRDTFYAEKNGWSYVCFEYIKLYMARQMGHF